MKLLVGKTKKGEGTKIMAIVDGASLPLGISIASASPHEITLVEEVIASITITENLGRLIGDNLMSSICE